MDIEQRARIVSKTQQLLNSMTRADHYIIKPYELGIRSTSNLDCTVDVVGEAQISITPESGKLAPFIVELWSAQTLVLSAPMTRLLKIINARMDTEKIEENLISIPEEYLLMLQALLQHLRLI